MTSDPSSTRAVSNRHGGPRSVVERITNSNILLITVCALPGLFTTTLLTFSSSSYNPIPVPLFDASPDIIDVTSSPYVRWDAIHFLSVAARGYEYEQHLAFQPGWHAVLALIGRIYQFVAPSENTGQSLEGAITRASLPFMLLLAGLRGCLLFRLSESMLDRRIAIISTLLYLLAPTPAVLVSPYTEPLYACYTFAGYKLAHRRRYLLAGLSLAGATSLRATGIFTAPFLAAFAIFQDGTYRIPIKVMMRRGLLVALPCLIIILPFLSFQAYAYLAFCTPEPTRPWCHSRLPLAYSFVQAEYWNVGFLNYWTPDQIPNLLIASPVLSVSILGLYRHFTSLPLSPSSSLSASSASSQTPHTRLVPLPLAVHHALMTFLLIFGSHTQIALRVVSTDPVFWWLLADLAFKKGPKGAKGMANGEPMTKMTRLGQAWVYWTVIWGAISIVLWVGHYPPA